METKFATTGANPLAITETRGLALLKSATGFNDVNPDPENSEIEIFDLYVPKLWNKDKKLVIYADARRVENQGVKPDPVEYLQRPEVNLYEFYIESL
jgi:hypothetical protein